jgi:hypothetical protein
MAEQVLKLQELKDFFVAITCQMLNIDPTTSQGKGKVRSTWPLDGQPSRKISDDIVFIRVVPQDNKLARELNIVYQKPEDVTDEYLIKNTGYTRVHEINFTFYGPNGYDNADIIRYSIFSYDYMLKFREKNLFLITDVAMPTRLPELYNAQWWERTDFSCTFNEAVIRETQVPYINSTDIQVIPNR